MKRPHAYIRKSVVHKGDRVLSTEVQAAEVAKLAKRYGDTELVILEDIGRSGRKVEKRPGYAKLLQDIAAGKVSAVYAYSLSRLNRSTRDYADLADLCVEKQVPVRLVHEGEQDFATPTGRLIATVLSAVAQMQAEIDGERARDVIARRIANGERHGEKPYGEVEGESLEAVIDAYRAAGSLSGAARVLDERGIPTRRGGPWRRGSVRKILAAQAPGVVPQGQVARVKGAPPFRLARLLRCHCGRTLTGIKVNGLVRYRCADARGDSHGKVSIAESRIMDRIIDEWDNFDHAGIRLLAEEHDAERVMLTDRLDKLSRQHEMGVIDDATLASRANDVQDALQRLRTAEMAADLPDSIDWQDDDVRAVNTVLRAAWDHVELDDDLQPRRAVWRFDVGTAA